MDEGHSKLEEQPRQRRRLIVVGLVTVGGVVLAIAVPYILLGAYVLVHNWGHTIWRFVQGQI